VDSVVVVPDEIPHPSMHPTDTPASTASAAIVPTPEPTAIARLQTLLTLIKARRSGNRTGSSSKESSVSPSRPFGPTSTPEPTTSIDGRWMNQPDAPKTILALLRKWGGSHRLGLKKRRSRSALLFSATAFRHHGLSSRYWWQYPPCAAAQLVDSAVGNLISILIKGFLRLCEHPWYRAHTIFSHSHLAGWTVRQGPRVFSGGEESLWPCASEDAKGVHCPHSL
jgi:hypothetical protein